MGATPRLGLRRMLGLAGVLLLGCSGESTERAGEVANRHPGDGATAVERDPAPATASASLEGRELPPWQVGAWANTEPLEVAALRGKVVVVRFWTDTCPYCRASMPALQGLAEAFADEPVVFVGLYHEKPEGRAGAWAGAKTVADGWGITFPIGHDTNWATLRSWWLSTDERAATSSTIVLGKDGKVIHVHPGPVYFPSDDEKDAQPNRDFEALRDAIAAGIADDG